MASKARATQRKNRHGGSADGNVGIVAEDLDTAVAFFTELGMEVEGKAQIEGLFADQAVGLNGVRSGIAMMRTPDGHGKLELAQYHIPAAIGDGSLNPPPNTPRMHRVMFAVDDIDDTIARLRPMAPNCSVRWRGTRTCTASATSAAPRAPSSPRPNGSADGSSRPTCEQSSAGWMTVNGAVRPCLASTSGPAHRHTAIAVRRRPEAGRGRTRTGR